MALNRPKALNALNMALIAELNGAPRSINVDKEIGADRHCRGLQMMFPIWRAITHPFSRFNFSIIRVTG
jgi:hypothetical protein